MSIHLTPDNSNGSYTVTFQWALIGPHTPPAHQRAESLAYLTTTLRARGFVLTSTPRLCGITHGLHGRLEWTATCRPMSPQVKAEIREAEQERDQALTLPAGAA